MTALATTPRIVGLSRAATPVHFSRRHRLMLGGPSAGQSSALVALA
jgi:hypothetical protein